MSDVAAARRMPTAAAPAPDVTLREFEELIDSSLRIADHHKADRDVKGELWIMRDCRWIYLPYRFRCIYHVNRGRLAVIVFQAQRAGGPWRSVRTTDEYRAILMDADAARRSAI